VINQTVDLYSHYGQQRAEENGGLLTCWVQETPAAVSSCRKRPAILILPGGGYGHTSSREAEPVALRFAAIGWAAFVLHYSCAPSRFPKALREAAMAMRYIREQAEGFEIDPGMVAALGFSAGGHLCGTLGMLFDSPEVADLGAPEQLRPDALCLCYPVAVSWGRTHQGSFENLCAGDTALRERLSLETLVRPDMPPVFLWHTVTDPLVPVENSLLFAAALQKEHIPFECHLFAEGDHGLSTCNAETNSISEACQPWLELSFRWLSDRFQFTY